MEEDILTEVEKEIQSYEAFLQERAPSPTFRPIHYIQEEPKSIEQLSLERDDDTEGTAQESRGSQLCACTEADSIKALDLPERDLADQSFFEEEHRREEQNCIHCSDSSDEENFSQIFDQMLSVESKAVPDEICTSITNQVLHAAKPTQVAALQPESTPRQEWFDFKTGKMQAKAESGPEEIVSSAHSAIECSPSTDTLTLDQNSTAAQSKEKRANRHSKQAVQKHIEEQMRKELTFRPELISRTFVKLQNRQDRLQQLSRPRIPKSLKSLQLDRKIGDEADVKECTFKPQTGRPPEKDSVCLPVEERLYRVHNNKNSALARDIIERERETLAECTFHPVTNSNKSPSKCYAPLQERAMEIMLAKKERQVLHRTDEAATFAPAINPRSKRIALQKEKRQLKDLSSTDGFCMISDFDSQNKDTHLDYDREDVGPSPIPRMNPSSKRMLESLNVPEDFITRQHYFDELKRKRQQALKLEMEEQECTFSPKVNSLEDVLAASRFAGRLLEDQEEFLERLSHKDQVSQSAKTAALQHSHATECTFQPSINAISKLIGKSRTVEELYEEGKRKNRQAEQKREEQVTSDCTFAPCLERSSRGNARTKEQSYSQVEERLWKAAQNRESIRAKKKQESEDKDLKQEMKDCTFTPHIKHHVPRSKGPVVIAGLGRYLELQHQAQRLKEEQRQREEAKFHLKANKLGAKFTIPVPFDLSEAPRRV